LPLFTSSVIFENKRNNNPVIQHNTLFSFYFQTFTENAEADMIKFMLILSLIPIILFNSSSLKAQDKRALTVEDLWAMKRIGSFDVSPDNKLIVFSITTYDMDSNKGNSDIYLIDSDGKNLKALKNSDKNESSPHFTPDGNKISYIINDQVHVCNADGSDDHAITNLYTGVSDYRWSPDGKKLLLISSVYPDCPDQNCCKKKDEEKKNSKVNARIITHLMYKEWNRWLDDKRSHLFLFDLAVDKYYDLNLGMENDVPPLDLGSSSDFNFSPDGNEIAYTMNPDSVVAWSTNNEIYTVNLKNVKEGEKAPANKISQSKGVDNQPKYSPDGKYIAFASMLVPGHESDQSFLFLYDRKSGKLENMSKSLDRSIGEFVWSPDSKEIYFTANNEIFNSVYKLDVQSDKVELMLKDHSNENLSVSKDGKTIFFMQQKSTQSYEIFAMDNTGKNIRQITHLNSELLSKIEMNPVETFWFEGAGGKRMESILVKPPFFDPSKKYPMIFLIHGGPQGHWEDDFHYRWNTELFSSKGYVVIAPNPHGSTGYGHAFTNEISKDWGGKAYNDLMDAYDYAIKNFKYIDPKNTFAAGASYGGYMINWMEGHTDRFNAVVSHDGVYNTVSEYGTTEELWFPEWEFDGTPYNNRKLYEKWNPLNFIQNATTPMLIFEGANDFRVPQEQAFQLFTALQRLGVESKFIYFPDEYHFVVKPQDARLWWNSIFDWFAKHKKGE
jgi:dipeptidyl aminopeptidase/acylaminoacyl peptidase